MNYPKINHSGRQFNQVGTKRSTCNERAEELKQHCQTGCPFIEVCVQHNTGLTCMRNRRPFDAASSVSSGTPLVISGSKLKARIDTEKKPTTTQAMGTNKTVQKQRHQGGKGRERFSEKGSGNFRVKTEACICARCNYQ